MIWEAAGTAAALGAGAAWAVRGRASSLFGPNVWQGPPNRRAIALTFDDGPSESTPELVALLNEYRVRATFFQCGANAERLHNAARAVSLAGQEVGNHTHSHPRLYLRSPRFVQAEITQGQQKLARIHNYAPRWFRAPYGVRWFGMRAAMRRCGLTHAAWSTIAGDWHLNTAGVITRCRDDIRPGAIWCFHDGRELSSNPDIRVTLDSIRQLLPVLQSEGYELVTLTEMFRERTQT